MLNIIASVVLFSLCKGCLTLWLKVKRLLISTKHIARNQEFGLLTLHTRAQSPRLSLSEMPIWQYCLTKAMNSQRKFGPDKNGKAGQSRWLGRRPKLWSRGHRFFFIKKIKKLKIKNQKNQKLSRSCSL